MLEYDDLYWKWIKLSHFLEFLNDEGLITNETYEKRFEDLADLEPKEEGKQEIEGLSASEAVYGFVAWITTRDKAMTASSSHGAAPWADKVAEFIKVNKLPDPRDDWADKLIHPKD